MKKKIAIRNPYVILARSRNGAGRMKDRRTKRLNGKNKQVLFLGEE